MGLDRARWDSLVGACPTHRVEAAGGEHRRKRRRGFLKAAVVVRKSTGLKTRLALAHVLHPGPGPAAMTMARGEGGLAGSRPRACAREKEVGARDEAFGTGTHRDRLAEGGGYRRSRASVPRESGGRSRRGHSTPRPRPAGWPICGSSRRSAHAATASSSPRELPGRGPGPTRKWLTPGLPFVRYLERRPRPKYPRTSNTTTTMMRIQSHVAMRFLSSVTRRV